MHLICGDEVVTYNLFFVFDFLLCILSGIGISKLLTIYLKQLDEIRAATGSVSSSSGQGGSLSSTSKKRIEAATKAYAWKRESSYAFVGIATFMLISYGYHCIWVTSEAYSSPSIVLSARSHDGSRIIFDDFREAYYWLRMNTHEDAKIMSWWDYG